MRFRSLYRYSYSKSPADLRPAVVACKLTLSLSIVSTLLFVAALISLFYHQPDNLQAGTVTKLEGARLPAANSNNTSSEPPESTFARQQEDSLADHSSSPLARYLADYLVVLCLITGALLLLLTLASISYAYYTYRRYLQSRLTSYQLVNRSFDQLQLEQLAKVHVRQPIITPSKGATVLVPKNVPLPDWLQHQEEASTSGRSKFANWARSKWTRVNQRADERNNNHNRNRTKKPLSKDMTI